MNVNDQDRAAAKWMKAYIARAVGGSEEHITIDICVPLCREELEDLERYFELAMRQLRRQLADQLTQEPSDGEAK